MLLPTNIFVLLMSLPLLIVSSPQYFRVSGISACSRNSPCDADNYCNGEQCVPCNAAGCGIGAICTVGIGRIFCECPANTQGDATDRCHPVIGCINNSQCNRDEYCQSGFCVKLCKLITCGQGAFCQVFDGQPKCYCPVATEGNPYTKCFSTKDKIVGNRQSITQVGNNGDGNQVNIQVGGAQGVNQDDGIQVNNHGGGTKVVNQGGGTQVDSGNQASSGTQNGSNNQVSGTQSGSNAQVDSGVQVNNQGGSTLGGCRINSHCRSDERCQSGSCIDPCVSVRCGEEAICQVSQRQGQCVCPENRQGNPNVHCIPKPVCSNDSDCRDSETCTLGLGSCVNKCDAIQCGEGAKCQLSRENKPTCICPANTNGDPFILCKPKQENPMNDATQPSTPSSVTASNQKNPMNDATQPSTTPSSATASNESDVFFPDHVSENEQGTRNPGCENAPDPGECRGAFKRFYYNKQNDQCDCFLFGGCDEEKIKFTWLTFEECQRTCVPGNKTQGQGCKRVSLEEVQSFLEEEQRNRENSKN